MKKLFSILLLIVFTTLVIAAQQQPVDSIAGNWLGALDVGSGVKLRLVLKITKTADGFAAKLDSIDQGAKDLPVDTLTQNENRVNFSAARFGMSFEGTLNENANEISGTLKQGSAAVSMVFKRAVKITQAVRPQNPQKPYPYKEEDVSYKNVRDNVKLAGTLTVPPGKGKFPAVILITGSGAQDRDETMLGHRPFLVLADYLTRKGIAVLRVDDRGVGGSELGSLSATTENFAGDVIAGIEFLKTRPEINPKQIGLIGHSEGGIIAPIAAARSKDVAFIVMLAGSGQTGEDVILTQLALLQQKSGALPEAISQAVNFQKSLLAIIKSEPDDKLAEQKIGEMLANLKTGADAKQLSEFTTIEKNVKTQLPLLLSPWYRHFLAYDPRPTLEKIKIPVLALNGENDLQVSAQENLEIISAALRKAGNKDFTIKSIPHLNHLFQTSRTGLPNEYEKIEETFSPGVLATISEWILKRVS